MPGPALHWMLMKKPRNKSSDELRPEYNLRELFRKGVRGKHAKACRVIQLRKVGRAHV